MDTCTACHAEIADASYRNGKVLCAPCWRTQTAAALREAIGDYLLAEEAGTSWFDLKPARERILPLMQALDLWAVNYGGQVFVRHLPLSVGGILLGDAHVAVHPCCHLSQADEAA
jgi:hypothetical protein